MKKLHNGLAFVAALALTCTYVSTAIAGEIKCDPIRIIDPYPPGGSTGNLARLVAEKMSRDLEKTVLVENIGGASGSIGSARVARAEPDGCTLVIGNDATHATNYHLFPDSTFHPLKDATPITLAAKNIIVLGVAKDFPANNMQEFIEYAKNNPEKLFYGSSGIGSPHHLSGPLLNDMADIELTHAPYQNGPPALADVLGGHLPMLFASVSVALPHIESGALKALGVTEPQRFPGLPDVAAIAETVPGFSMTSWVGFFGPPNLPVPIRDELYQSMKKALESEDVEKSLANMGLLVAALPPDEFKEKQKEEFELRAKIIADNKITKD